MVQCLSKFNQYLKYLAQKVGINIPKPFDQEDSCKIHLSMMLLKWQTLYKTTTNWSAYDDVDLNIFINKLKSIEAHMIADTKVD